MNSTVETSAALAPATARFDRQHAGARQQRWMAELEQAMLAQQPGQRPVETAHQPVPQAAQAVAQGARAVTRPAAQAAAQGAPAAPAGAPHGDGTAGQQAATASAGAQEHAGGTATGELAARHATPDAADRVDAEDGTAALAGAAVVAPAVLANAAAPSAAAFAAALAASGAEPAAATGTIGTTDVAVARAGLGLAFGLANASPQAEGMPEAPMQAGAGADEAAPGEEYSRNLLHLFHGEDGVQAYIRDAELTGAQMRAVAQALAAELGGSGTRLAALTINGRRLPLGAATAYEQYEEEGPALAQAAPAARRPSIEQKGAI